MVPVILFLYTVLAYLATAILTFIGTYIIGAVKGSVGSSMFAMVFLPICIITALAVAVVMSIYEITIRLIYGKLRFNWSPHIRRLIGALGGFISLWLSCIGLMSFLKAGIHLNEFLTISVYSLVSATVGAVLMPWLMNREERMNEPPPK